MTDSIENVHPTTRPDRAFSLSDRIHAYQEQPNVTINSTQRFQTPVQVNYPRADGECAESGAHNLWYGSN